MCAVEDLEAEQDDMDSSGVSLLGLLDTSAVDADSKSVKRVSGATGGRSGLKLSRPANEKTSKSSEPEAKKKSPRRQTLQTSTGCKRVRRNLSSETQLSADANEPAEQSEHKASRSATEDLVNQTNVAGGQASSTERRVTRCNSDLKLSNSDSVQCPPVNSKDLGDTVTPADSCVDTE